MESVPKTEEIHLSIDVAQPDDVEALYDLVCKTWLATYPNEEIGITKEDIESRFTETMTPQWIAEQKENLSHESSDEIVVIAKLNGRVVGMCSVVTSGDINEISALYVLPEYQKKGVGNQLLEKIHTFLDPEKETQIQVASYNIAAVDFYTSHGFEVKSGELFDEHYRMKNGAIIPTLILSRPRSDTAHTFVPPRQ